MYAGERKRLRHSDTEPQQWPATMQQHQPSDKPTRKPNDDAVVVLAKNHKYDPLLALSHLPRHLIAAGVPSSQVTKRVSHLSDVQAMPEQPSAGMHPMQGLLGRTNQPPSTAQVLPVDVQPEYCEADNPVSQQLPVNRQDIDIIDLVSGSDTEDT